jgi:hypothetical protein
MSPEQVPPVPELSPEQKAKEAAIRALDNEAGEQAAARLLTRGGAKPINPNQNIQGGHQQGS